MIPGPLLRTLGARVLLKGDVTTNVWVGPRGARDLEASLGFGEGRLSGGWTVLVLKQKLQPADFEFGGLTMRSGGRLGLPASDPLVDRARVRVSDEVLREHGRTGYSNLQRCVLRDIPDKGSDRIVKVIPTIRHSSTMNPSEQYPMGGGGRQWTLVRDCEFMVAMTVDQHSIARIPGFSVVIGDRMRLDDRMKLARYINEA